MALKDELVPKPRQKSTKKANVPSEILEGRTTFFENFCCLRPLAGKQLRKKQLPGLKDESSKTTPKKCLTSRLKS